MNPQSDPLVSLNAKVFRDGDGMSLSVVRIWVLLKNNGTENLWGWGWRICGDFVGIYPHFVNILSTFLLHII